MREMLLPVLLGSNDGVTNIFIKVRRQDMLPHAMPGNYTYEVYINFLFIQ